MSDTLFDLGPAVPTPAKQSLSADARRSALAHWGII